MWEAGYEAYSKIMLKSGKAGRSLKTASKVKMRRIDTDADEFDLLKQAAENWLTITDPRFEPSDEMVSDGVMMLPIEWKEGAENTWEKHKSTSGLVRNIFAVKDAFKAMIAKAGD